MCPEFPCGLLWVRWERVGVVIEHVRVGSDVFLFADIPIGCVGIILVRVWCPAPASFSLGGNGSSGLRGLLWEGGVYVGCWTGLVWVRLCRWFSRALRYFMIAWWYIGGAVCTELAYILVRRRDLISVMEAGRKTISRIATARLVRSVINPFFPITGPRGFVTGTSTIVVCCHDWLSNST